MSKRDKIIESFKHEEDKILAAKTMDCIEQVQKYFEPRFTQFLDPAQVIKVSRIIYQFNDIRYKATCGIEGCERNIIAIYPDRISEEKIELPVTALHLSCKSKFEKINHRDVLGALMNLGIKREKVGDIFVNDEDCYIIVYNDISYYIIINLNKIKRISIKVDYVDIDNILKKEVQYKEIFSNTASLRLDAILSCGFGESRSSLVDEITKGNVKVNWEVITESSRAINEGDTVSLKGKGRIILDKIVGKTKKDRINIIIKRVI